MNIFTKKKTFIDWELKEIERHIYLLAIAYDDGLLEQREKDIKTRIVQLVDQAATKIEEM